MQVTDRPELACGLTVLVVDDDSDMRQYLSICVGQSHQCTIIEAREAVEALAMARSANPDLVICDVGVPFVGGLSLCGAFEQDPLLCHIPILLIGNEPANAHPHAHAFVVKPFNASVLRRLVTELFEYD
jgi:CheY-like chemotaxis protein